MINDILNQDRYIEHIPIILVKERKKYFYLGRSYILLRIGMKLIYAASFTLAITFMLWLMYAYSMSFIDFLKTIGLFWIDTFCISVGFFMLIIAGWHHKIIRIKNKKT